MKFASITSIVIVISWVSLTITMCWVDAISAILYWKITVTMILVGGGVILVSLIAREYLTDKRMKKNKLID